MPTTRDDVIWMLDLIAACGGHPVLAGGWGVDALLGEQSRPHRDLDVLLEDDLIPVVLAALESAGFVVTTDWRPVRIELCDEATGRYLDLHPLFDDGLDGFWQHGLEGTRFDYPADTVTTGTIDGREVRCLTSSKQIDLHHGYEPRDEDALDLARLAGLLQPDHWSVSSSVHAVLGPIE